jgi:hypothetical protein
MVCLFFWFLRAMPRKNQKKRSAIRNNIKEIEMPSNKKRSVSATAAASTPTAANKATSATRASFTQEFNPDYSIVVNDLKRIGIMAGGFLVILVALSFFLR